MLLFQASDQKPPSQALAIPRDYAREEAALLTFSQGFDKVKSEIRAGSYSQAAVSLSSLESEFKKGIASQSDYTLFLAKISDLKAELEGTGKSLFKRSRQDSSAISEFASMISNDSKLLYYTRYALNICSDPKATDDAKAQSLITAYEGIIKLDLIGMQPDILKIQFENGHVEELLSTFEALNNHARNLGGNVVLLAEVAVFDEKKHRTLWEKLGHYAEQALTWTTNQVLVPEGMEKAKYWSEAKEYWKMACELPVMEAGFSVNQIVGFFINLVPGYASADEIVKGLSRNRTMPRWQHFALAGGYGTLDLAAFFTGGSTKAAQLLRSIGKGAKVIEGELDALKMAIIAGDKAEIERAVKAYAEHLNKLKAEFATPPSHKLGRITKGLSEKVSKLADNDLNQVAALNNALDGKKVIRESGMDKLVDLAPNEMPTPDEILKMADDLGGGNWANIAKEAERRLKFFNKEYWKTGGQTKQRLANFVDRKVLGPGAKKAKQGIDAADDFLRAEVYKNKLAEKVAAHADDLLTGKGTDVLESLEAYSKELAGNPALKGKLDDAMSSIKAFGIDDSAAQLKLRDLGKLEDAADPALKKLAQNADNTIASFFDDLSSIQSLKRIAGKIEARGLSTLSSADRALINSNETLRSALAYLDDPLAANVQAPLRLVPEKVRKILEKIKTHYLYNQVVRGAQYVKEANVAINVPKAALATGDNAEEIIHAAGGSHGRESNRAKASEEEISGEAGELVKIKGLVSGDKKYTGTVSIFEDGKKLGEYEAKRGKVKFPLGEAGAHTYKIYDSHTRRLKTVNAVVEEAEKSGEVKENKKPESWDTTDPWKNL